MKDIGRLAKGIEIIDERTVRQLASSTGRDLIFSSLFFFFAHQGYQILFKAPDEISRPARVVLPILTTIAKVLMWVVHL